MVKPEGYTSEEKKFMSLYRDLSTLVPEEKRKKTMRPCYLPMSVVLNKDQQDSLFRLRARNHDLFAHDMSDLVGAMCHYRPFRILTDKTPPIYLNNNRSAVREKEQMNEQIDELLKFNMIIPSRSALSFPAFLVPKPNNQMRLVIDYRELNKITKSHPFPMPRIVDILDQMVNSNFFH